MSSLRLLLKRVPGAAPAYRSLKRAKNAASSFASPFVRMFPAGHFYSPVPDIKQVIASREVLFRRGVTECPGIDLHSDAQLAVLDELARYYDELAFPESPTKPDRYYLENSFFKHGDAIVLYGMLRRLRPSRVIEVGSGFSSAAMLDTNDKFLDGTVQFTFIEPYPARVRNLLTEADQRRTRILETPIQAVPLEEFDQLAANDVLFIDSSHVVKIGSDVRHILWEVLPRLKAGVVIHFHDVFWPFEYLEDWVLRGNAWNEAYFLRTFLQYNAVFQIEYFNSYMATVHRAALEAKMPLCLKNPGAGLWIRKRA
jgi:predicted O-methyltransferase YrrM